MSGLCRYFVGPYVGGPDGGSHGPRWSAAVRVLSRPAPVGVRTESLVGIFMPPGCHTGVPGMLTHPWQEENDKIRFRRPRSPLNGPWLCRRSGEPRRQATRTVWEPSPTGKKPAGSSLQQNAAVTVTSTAAKHCGRGMLAPGGRRSAHERVMGTTQGAPARPA